jgi:hypothetical protein
MDKEETGKAQFVVVCVSSTHEREEKGRTLSPLLPKGRQVEPKDNPFRRIDRSSKSYSALPPRLAFRATPHAARFRSSATALRTRGARGERKEHGADESRKSAKTDTRRHLKAWRCVEGVYCRYQEGVSVSSTRLRERRAHWKESSSPAKERPERRRKGRRRAEGDRWASLTYFESFLEV